MAADYERAKRLNFADIVFSLEVVLDVVADEEETRRDLTRCACFAVMSFVENAVISSNFKILRGRR